MPHQVQQLINKIRSEGLDQANAKAEEIEHDAKQKAAQIVADAEQKAHDMIMDAEQEVKKRREAGERALEQAARNMLISLRKDIESILSGIIAQEVGAALSQEQVAQLLEKAITSYMAQDNSVQNIQAVFDQDTAQPLSHHCLAQLKEKFKADVVFKPSSDVKAGFMISFDAGKTNFDFTDESLASFLSVYVNDQLGAILKRTVN